MKQYLLLYLFFPIFFFSQNQESNQGEDCSNAIDLIVNKRYTEPITLTDKDITLDLASNCFDGKTLKEEIWFKFTITEATLQSPILTTITTSTLEGNLGLQLFSGVTCDTISSKICVDNQDNINAQTEVLVTEITTAGTYYLRVLNVGDSTLNMILDSISVKTENTVPSTGYNSYTLCSGSLFDHGGLDNDYSDNADGYSVIYPAIAGSVFQISGSLTSRAGDSLIIYDGIGTSGTILWEGTNDDSQNACNTIVLPTILSSGPVTVRFQSDNSDRCSGFQLDFNCVYSPCLTLTNGGVSTLSSSTGISSTVFTASVLDLPDGLSYQWQVSETIDGPWADIPNATSNIVSLTASPFYDTTLYYRLKTICTLSKNEFYSTISSFKTNLLNYCNSIIGNNNNPESLYFSTVNFLGTLNDTYNNSTFSADPRGFQDFTALPNRSSQVQGGGINVYFNTALNSTGTASKGKVRAWIDWNSNGVFEDSEMVYTTKGTGINSATFGFVIPENQTPGDYRLRLRMSYSSSIPACNTINDNGETEDYLFTVLPNCSAQILSVVAVERCGTGGVLVEAQGTVGTTKLRWYTSELGGSYVETDADSEGRGSYTFLNVDESTTFYVAAFNGTCESLIRKPIKVNIKPTPLVSFTFGSDIKEFCGKADYVILSSAVEQEEVTLVEEDFETGTFGQFSVFPTQISDYNNKTKWQVKASTYVPNQSVWYPAISSGPNANQFAFATSDVGANGVDTTITATNIATVGFSKLKLSFDVYFSYYGNNDSFNIEVSTDNSNWTTVQTYTSSLGIGTRFEHFNLELDDMYLNQDNLSIRFRYEAGYADGIALDNIRLYGLRPLIPSFMWTAPNISVYNSDCTTPYNGATESICIKADDDQITNFESWDVNATVSLANGCSAVGDVNIKNNNKVWDTNLTTDWATTNWKPNSEIPTIDKCVIVKQPLMVGTQDAEAKSVRVDPTGTLTIEADRTLVVDNEIVNLASGDQVVVENNANLIQVNDTQNEGDITVKRNTFMKKNDYTFWGTPVEIKSLTNLSSGKVFTYNEWNDYYTLLNTTSIFDDKAKGYAILTEPNYSTTGITGFTKAFVGVPNNGFIESSISRLGRGYNLVGNPYPSNFDFVKFYEANSDTIYNSAYFWTNINHNPDSQGSNYPSGGAINNYAVLNGTGGIPATNAKQQDEVDYLSSEIPNEFIKVGQGFIIRKKEGSRDSLVFNNSMRTNDNSGHFFRKKEKDRYWLELRTPMNIYTTILVGYLENATNDFEIDYDATLMTLGSDAFYSMLGTRRLGIQGKASFVDTDVVILGTSHHASGEYTISAPKREGIFSTSQSIYLKDKQTGMITDLTKEDYTFTANKGISEGRFEIVYQPSAILDVVDNNMNSNDVLIYKDGDHFVVKSKTSKIMKFQLFNVAGQYLISANPKQKEFKWNQQKMNNQVYIVTIYLENGEVVTRKILK